MVLLLTHIRILQTFLPMPCHDKPITELHTLTHFFFLFYKLLSESFHCVHNKALTITHITGSTCHYEDMHCRWQIISVPKNSDVKQFMAETLEQYFLLLLQMYTWQHLIKCYTQFHSLVVKNLLRTIQINVKENLSTQA